MADRIVSTLAELFDDSMNRYRASLGPLITKGRVANQPKAHVPLFRRA